MWTFSVDDMVAARDEAKRDAEEFGGNTAYMRLGNAHLWLDEHDEARRAYQAAADDIRERVFARGRGDNAATLEKYGLLLLRSGDDAGARAAFEQALPLAREPWREAELRFLLGQGEPKPREEIVKVIRAERLMPDTTASGMTSFDELEATFPDGTSHLEMLRQAGLLVDDAPPPPAIKPPPVGRWTVRDAVLENDGEGPVVARLGGDVCVEFVESFGQWEVRVYRGDVQHNITGMHDTFGVAVDAAIDALRADDDEYAVTGLTDLLKQYGQPH